MSMETATSTGRTSPQSLRRGDRADKSRSARLAFLYCFFGPAIDADEDFKQFLSQVGEFLTANQSRIVRRLHAAWSALAIADGLAGVVNDEGRAGIQLVYPSPEAAELLVKALDRIRRDMNLAVKGGLEQGEIDQAQAVAYEADISRLKVERTGSSVLLWEE